MKGIDREKKKKRLKVDMEKRCLTSGLSRTVEKEGRPFAVKQDRIRGHQMRTGGQGRKCTFPHLPTCGHGLTDRRTKALIELRVRN